MSSDAQQFARFVLDAFAHKGRHTDADIKAAGGPSDTYMTGLRKTALKGEPLRPLRSDTARRIDAAAGWAEGSAMHLWHFGVLPPRAETRPAAPDDGEVTSVATRIRRDPDSGEVVATMTSVAEIGDGESRLEVRFWPGRGRSITTFDLTGALSGVHRKAMRATHIERGEAHVDGAPATNTPGPRPADQLGKDDYELIGHDEEHDIEAEQTGEE